MPREFLRSESLAGSLLVAHPALRDPNFRRSVVLMSSHDKAGAMGVVINRPLGRRLGDLGSEYKYGVLAEVPVFNGGPVQPDRLLLVAWEIRDDGYRLHFGIAADRAEGLLGADGVRVRGYLGYSGWTAGQLEGEMLRQTWILASAPADLFERAPDESLWKSILAAEGADWKLLAEEPEDPELN